MHRLAKILFALLLVFGILALLHHLPSFDSLIRSIHGH
jgi:hypothetical protein